MVRKEQADALGRSRQRSNYSLKQFVVLFLYALVLGGLMLFTDRLLWLGHLGIPVCITMAICFILPYGLCYIDERIEQRLDFFGAFSAAMLPFSLLLLHRIGILYPWVESAAIGLCALLIVVMGWLMFSDVDRLRRQSRINRRLIMLLCNAKRVVATVALVTACAVGVYSAAGGFVQQLTDEDAEREAQLEQVRLLNPQDWPELSRGERMEVLRVVAELEAKELGLVQTPILCALQLGDSTYGVYNHGASAIFMDTELVKEESYVKCLKTLLHELRHCYQYCMVEAYYSVEQRYTGLACWTQARQWIEGIDNYAKDSRRYSDYYDNAIEVDARDYADTYAESYVWTAVNECGWRGIAAVSEEIEINGTELTVVVYDDYIQLVYMHARDTRLLAERGRIERTDSPEEVLADIAVVEGEEGSGDWLVLRVGQTEYRFGYVDEDSYIALASEWQEAVE